MRTTNRRILLTGVFITTVLVIETLGTQIAVNNNVTLSTPTIVVLTVMFTSVTVLISLWILDKDR